MARMTKRLQPNNVIVYKFGKYEDTIAAEMETSDVRTVLKALADYEDLEEQCIEENQCGLRELLMKWKAFFDDIAGLYDYRKAEEQGLLLRLPCKVGTKVYALVNECEEMYEPSSWYTTISEESFDIYMIDAFGKEVFLTREEAESALAENEKAR